MPNVDRRSWNSRFKQWTQPKPPRPRKPRPPKKKRLPQPKLKRLSGVLNDPIVTYERRQINVTDGSTIFYDKVNRLSSSYGSGPGFVSRIWAGTTTPDFFVKRARKQRLPFNSYSVVLRSSDGTAWNNEQYVWPISSTFVASCATQVDTFWPSSQSDRVTQEASFVARSRLVDKVNSHSFNAGVAFAERKQTANLLSSTVTRVARSALALRKGNLGEAYTIWGMPSHVTPSPRQWDRLLATPPSKRLANHWLEYSFGWTPLLNDARNAAELLARHVSGDLYHESATTSGKAKADWVVLRNPSAIASETPVQEQHSQSVRIKFVTRYRLDSYARAGLASTGITNPLAVAWEILPYSFVIDWFVPVNKYLEGLMAFDGFELQGGYQTKLWHGTVYKYFDRLVGYSSGFRKVSGNSFFDEVIYRRDPMFDFPASVPPTFRDPLEKGPLWKAVTSMALMRQLFAK